ncbi:MAG: hypothetical protein KatS3mg102_0154 [Planctomycetota bacterium]|nr:MAG: hypothetical protein KatS3mg102_0154 [Planctomycetota bacterium]
MSARGEGRGRFAQQPPRQQPPPAEGIRRIEQHQVEVAPQPPVLKAVVQQQAVGTVLEQRPPGAPHPIGVLHEGDLRQALGQAQRLVVSGRLRGVRRSRG